MCYFALKINDPFLQCYIVSELSYITYRTNQISSKYFILHTHCLFYKSWYSSDKFRDILRTTKRNVNTANEIRFGTNNPNDTIKITYQLNTVHNFFYSYSFLSVLECKYMPRLVNNNSYGI